MDPPSYDEARFIGPSQVIQTISSNPPPTYDASIAIPPTPPPGYIEAVTSPTNPFPVLTPPLLATVEPAHRHTNGVVVHPVTRVGAHQHARGAHNHPSVVVTQPAPVPVRVTCLSDFPAVIRCPHCRHTVTTKVKFVASDSAWCLCVILALLGLFCGCCLIPLMVRSMQDAHHSCPHCGKRVHVYRR
ncbi:unnamed protein product [Ophioblennius macclurei]